MWNKKAQQTINKAKAAFIRERTMRLGASCDLWGLIKAMDKRIPTAKPSASIAKPNSDKRAITDREKADPHTEAF